MSYSPPVSLVNPTGTGQVDWDQGAYELAAYYALRPQLIYDQFASVKPSNLSMNGASVTWTFQNDLAAATSTISETTDVTPVALSTSQLTLALAEFGSAAVTTALIQNVSMIPFDPVVANVVGFNAGLSLDGIARNVVQAGTNVRYVTGSARNAQTASSLLTGNHVRQARTDLMNAFVQPFGEFYAAVIHSDVAYDFTGATGGANFRDPHTYSDPSAIWNGEIGAFGGFRFMETPRSPQFVGAGAGTTPNITSAYRTLFMGQQAIAKAYAPGVGAYPRVRPGPVTDTLWRFAPVGWYWLGNYGIFRQAAIRGVESSSSIGPLS